MLINRVRVKVCGITRPEDAIAAAYAGADAIGMVFHTGSKRAVNIGQAKGIIAVLPPFVTKVGLFVDQPKSFIQSVIDELSVDMLQFHGEESQQHCLEFSKPFIKAIRMRPGIDLLAEVSGYDECSGVLLDSYVSGVAGGTGRSFDWKRIPKGIKKPVILAGGLNPHNVYDAIQHVNPYAVDVSGGVESEPGIKDSDKITAFIRNARGLN